MSFGKDTDLSVKIVLHEIGYDYDEIVSRGMCAKQMVDFAINIAIDYREWFEARFSEPTFAECVRAILHAFGLRLEGVPFE